MDKFSEPEQFDAEVEIHGGEPFAVWSPAVNGSHVKKEQYFALLAELEAKDKRIAELEEQKTKWVGWSNELGAKLDAAEKRLATPVRLPDELEPNTEPCVICGKISSHPEGWHYCNRKNAEGDA